jgi:hypothetical protein
MQKETVMIKRGIVLAVLLLFVGSGFSCFMFSRKYTTVHEEKTGPPPDADFIPDDKLADKKVEFDPELVDSRPYHDLLINKSAAIIKLDILGEHNETLYPSYAAAVKAAGESGHEVLLSINYIDGKAKQIDDGLYAALDLAYYKGMKDVFESHVSLIKRLLEKTKSNPKCEAFLAAGLHYAGVEMQVKDSVLMKKYRKEFEEDELRSKPASFYTWSDDLERCFRFLRFFQYAFADKEEEIAIELGKALLADKRLLQDYNKVIAFFDGLSNPHEGVTLEDLIRHPSFPKVKLDVAVCLLPDSGSKENLLIRSLFNIYGNIPSDVNIMKTLIQQIHSGKIDLKPDENSGWYDYQVYALETLLLPSKGEESNKLLLTQRYKKRMIEAFKAMLTTRRETHYRQMPGVGCSASSPYEGPTITPRLRVEPCPSYYIRQARGYDFLLNFLTSAIGEKALREIHGLKEGGEREMTLWDELHWIRDFYYGLYLISCEDIGLRPSFLKDENVDIAHCYEIAEKWLGRALEGEDLAVDTRVSVPIAFDLSPSATHLWVNIGVKLLQFEASFATPPSIKYGEESEWREVSDDELDKKVWLIPVVQFAEVKVEGHKVFDRNELRAICDKHTSREAIIKALGN